MNRLLIFFFVFLLKTPLNAQTENDNCSGAFWLCFNQVLIGETTNNATVESCISTNLNGCADDYPISVGFVSSSSVWYKFTTNSVGGDVIVNVSNLIFNLDANKGQALQGVIFAAASPCEGQTYTQVGIIEMNGTSDFTLTANGLTANTIYYVMLNGVNTGVGVTEPADLTFDIAISGSAVEMIPPTATISADNTVLCQGDSETISTTITNCSDNVNMAWYYNNVLVNESAEFNTAQLSEDGYLKLIIECGISCVYRDTTDSLFFEVTPIEVNAGEDILITLGESAILDGTGTSLPVWTPETNLSSPYTFTPTTTATETTTYFLTVTNGTCELTDEMIVKIKEIITIPSGFTPNGDNTNDIWEIINIGQYPNNIVKIYDRSGQLVFKTTGYKNIDNRWNGTFNEKDLPTSTYFYVIDLRTGNKDLIFKGSVTIVR